ncbi:hypothetical protein BDA99DRAFT_531748 [Phascolomyces articulosus]|uniref:OTU domain-containing protein n=1 Tax=Phascolomyces articulosus TaxID=60185 RepID=A0AAD5KA84_9FUNG|nr:hypothetical protein BDA99DRAFT_531748 [Phascolomyces articulosus]
MIYRSLIINGYCRFQDFPAVTDVTYKAVEKGYYICTTIIYVPELKRHTIIFQAVLGGLKEEYFSQYFFIFFVDHKVRFDCSNSFLGMMLDFSMAQNIVHRLPLSLALPQLLNYIQSDVCILANYKEHAVPPVYNRAPRPKKKKSSIKKEVNDGRPLDVTKELVDENIILNLSYFDVQQTQECTLSQGKKEVETGTEEIMQRIMGMDLKKVDQEKHKEEKKNNKMSENTPDTMTKKSDRKNKKRKQHYDTEELWPSSKKSNRRETSFVHQDIPPDCSTGLKQIKADGYCSFRALALQLYGDQDQYQKVKQTMLNYLFANYEFYLDILAKAVKPYHEVGWGILGLNVEYNATWKYIYRKRLTQEEKQFLEISDTVDILDLI